MESESLPLKINHFLGSEDRPFQKNEHSGNDHQGTHTVFKSVCKKQYNNIPENLEKVLLNNEELFFLCF